MQKILLISALWFLAVPALAQTVEQDGAVDRYSTLTERAQKVFVAYHEAMEAEAECNHRSYSADDLLEMDNAAAAEMVAASPQISLGAARLLNLRREAEDEMDHLVSREGCQGQRVSQSLRFFDERLANVHSASDQAPYAYQSNAQQNGMLPDTAAPADMAQAPSSAAMPDANDQVPGSGTPVVLTPTQPQ